MRLSASLYAADLMCLGRQIDALAPYIASLHIDVMDGSFAPAFGFGEQIVREIATRYALPIDVHLMVADPSRWVRSFADAGARRIVFHIEATQHPRRIAADIRACGALAYVGLLPETPVSAASGIGDVVDGALLLTAPPGGGPFSKAALARVGGLASTMPIIVDGAIEPKHFGILRRTPVELVVVGRTLFQAEDVSARAGHLDHLISEAMILSAQPSPSTE